MISRLLSFEISLSCSQIKGNLVFGYKPFYFYNEFHYFESGFVLFRSYII